MWPWSQALRRAPLWGRSTKLTVRAPMPRMGTALARFSALATAGFDPNAPIKVLVGSQTGTAMSFAESLRDAAEARGLQNLDVVDLGEYDPSTLTDEEQLLLIMACYGQGEPTDNAKTFFKGLMSSQAPLPKLRYGVFGLGSSKTHKSNYNIIAKKVDHQLEQLGAARAFPLGLGDDSGWLRGKGGGYGSHGVGMGGVSVAVVSIEIDFQKWQQALLEHLAPSNPNQIGSDGADDAKAPQAGGSSVSRPVSADSDPELPFGLVYRPRTSCVASARDEDAQLTDLLQRRGFFNPKTNAMQVLYNRQLQPLFQDSMLELGLKRRRASATSGQLAPASPLYETGDHVGVYPVNDPSLVRRVLSRFGLDGDREIHVAPLSKGTPRKLPFPDGITVASALSRCLELQSMPQPSALAVMAGSAGHPGERARLMALASSPELYKDYVWASNRHFVDLLDEFPSVYLTLSALMQVVPPLRPRFYSISSSALRFPDELHITHRWVNYISSQGVARQGVCTRYLRSLQGQDGSRPVAGTSPCSMDGDVVQAFVRTSTFRLPKDPQTPVIFIAGGSGIAPLKAFLEERLLLATARGVGYGPGLLAFGVRCPDDLVYHDLIQDCARAGALTDASISFFPSTGSPALAPRTVAEDVEQHGAQIWKMLSKGGVLYLCGGASAFASSCNRAIRKVLERHGGMGTEEQDKYIQLLLETGRFQEDLAD